MAEKRKTDWTDALRKRMASSELEPEPGLWSKVEEAALARPEHRKTAFLPWWLATAAAAAAIAAAVILPMKKPSPQEIALVPAEEPQSLVAEAEPEITPVSEAAEMPAAAPQSSIAKPTHAATPQNSIATPEPAAAQESRAAETEATPQNSETETASAPQNSVSKAERDSAATDDETAVKKTEAQETRPAEIPEIRYQYQEPIRPVKARKGKGAGWATASLVAASYVGFLKSTDDWPPHIGIGAAMDAQSPAEEYSSSMPVTSQGDILCDTFHKFPLCVGLSGRFDITRRLFLTTGLDYSRYRTSFEYCTPDKQYYTHNQTAQYLGIPLMLNFDLIKGRHLDIYLGAGAKADCCISAKRNGEEVGKDGVILSFQGAAGVQWNIARKVGVYFEPQMLRTLTPGTQKLDTFRTENPWMFNIATGIRINFD